MASLEHRPGCARLGIARLNAFRLNVYEPVMHGAVGDIAIGGVGGPPGVGFRIDGASIAQVLNDQVDTAYFRTRGIAATAGQPIVIYSGDWNATQQLYGGRVIATTQVYESTKQNVAKDLRCVDETWLLNRRTVLATFTGAYAADIFAALLAWARGVTGVNVSIPRTAPYLIDQITFTNEYLPICFTAICERVGAHWYLDYQNDLHAFVTETPDANSITDATPHGAADLALTEDLSQVVTKVIGRGGGARAAVDTPVGATEVPVEEGIDQTWFSATGGLVETGAQVLTYAGMRGRGGLGSFVGSGNAPSAAPRPTPSGGSSHTIGATYGYAASFTTATGETVAGPIASIVLLASTAVAPPAVSARTRPSGSYPPGLISPGASGQIQFAAQIWYKNGTIGPIGANSPIYSWNGRDWEVYLGPRSYYTASDGSTVFYYPALEPAGPAGITNFVMIYRFDHGVGWNSASTDSYSSGEGWFYQCCCSYTGQPYTPTAATGVGSVIVKDIPVSKAAGVTGRKLYRTIANGAPLKLLTTITNNTATEFGDTVADAALGVAPPASDTSGVKDDGQVLAGATSLPVASTQPFADDVGPSGGGGWARVGAMPVRYTGIGAGVLTGIPATGNGSITAVTRYGTPVLVQPRLFGIPPVGTGAITRAILRGDTLTIRLEKIDIAARDLMANYLKPPGAPSANPEDGIIELVVSDSRFGLVELLDHVDATLADRKDVQRTITFTSRDLSLQVGRLLSVNTTQPPIVGTFRIHKIALSEIAVAGGRATVHPLKTVEASSKIYKFTDLLRRLRSMEAGVR